LEFPTSIGFPSLNDRAHQPLDFSQEKYKIYICSIVYDIQYFVAIILFFFVSFSQRCLFPFKA